MTDGSGPRDPVSHAEPAVFLGAGSFAVPILDALASAPGVRIVGVVTAPPRPAGRGERLRRSPVDVRAESLGLGPVLRPPRLRSESAISEVLALGATLLVLADYGQIVPGALLSAPAHGALNLHPSLLPRHRGATPVPATILAGDRQAGVSLMVMDEGLDTGPLVAQVAVPLDGTETAPELEAALAVEAAALLRAALPDWLAGRLAPHPQPSQGATLTRPLRREQGRLDPTRDASSLERQVRAFQPWPGTWLETADGRLVVWRARALAIDGAGVRSEPDALGRIAPDGDGLAVLVADGWLRLEEVQLAGKRRMSAADLRRGHPGLVGSRVGGAALP